MGMSIEEITKDIKNNVLPFDYRESLQVAIELLEKYQKIQEIYERFQKDGSYYHHMAWLDVMEVVEDGNNN